MPSNVTQGYLAAAASAFCFGSFAVPVKTKAVLAAKVDPIVFQCYKSLAALCTSFVTLAFVDVTFTPWGFLGASMWVSGAFPPGFTAAPVPAASEAAAKSLYSVSMYAGFHWHHGHHCYHSCRYRLALGLQLVMSCNGVAMHGSA